MSVATVKAGKVRRKDYLLNGVIGSGKRRTGKVENAGLDVYLLRTTDSLHLITCFSVLQYTCEDTSMLLNILLVECYQSLLNAFHAAGHLV